MAHTWNEISNDGSTTLANFYDKVAEVHDELGTIQRDIKAIENKIDMITSKIKYINLYKKNKNVCANYRKATDKDTYFRMHEFEIILFESSKEKLGKFITRELLSSVLALTTALNSLTTDVDEHMDKLSQQKAKVDDINHLRKNIEVYLRNKKSKNISLYLLFNLFVVTPYNITIQHNLTTSYCIYLTLYSITIYCFYYLICHFHLLNPRLQITPSSHHSKYSSNTLSIIFSTYSSLSSSTKYLFLSSFFSFIFFTSFFLALPNNLRMSNI